MLFVIVNVSRTSPSERIIQACNLLCDTSKQNEPNSFNEDTIAGWFNDPPLVFPALPGTAKTAPPLDSFDLLYPLPLAPLPNCFL